MNNMRARYLAEFEGVADRFNIELDELQEDDKLDAVYSEWKDSVNMTAGELRKWSRNPCSRQASVDPAAVIKRNLRLLEKDKSDWTSNDVEDAKRTVSFINRMKANQPDSPREGPHGCPSEWAISLLNWAFNPFDSVPSPSSEVKNDLEPVEEVSLSAGDTRKAAEIFHADQDKHSGSGSSEGVWIEPVAIHRVENESTVEVSDDVDEVLNRLWDENDE